ncbi:MAG: hypothetical protein KAS63_06200 [Candidatus Heimdallarchaeota archaeon]|nr:hypothetical protein [Candidatus Heimdallarchaeota archaeon]MCK4954933.1 hypothetical protein [Candidatus Heimdallarchaeota archaeon]
MNRTKQVLLITLLFSMRLFVYPTTSYMPEDVLVLDQVPMDFTPNEQSNLTVGIVVKNFLNFTITNITITLNLTDPGTLSFISCDFGELSEEEISLNSTIQSSSEYGFNASDITYGYLSSKSLTFNVTEIVKNAEFIFYYNITSSDSGSVPIPRVEMSYHDNWGDLQESISNPITIDFQSLEEEIDPDLPNWKTGNRISSGWGLVIFAIAPVFFAVMVSFVLYIRRR